MDKNFDGWNEVKKKVNKKNAPPFCYPREIWWCSLGLNVGSEEDGKNELFERPVLIVKIFNKETARIIPISSKLRNDSNHVRIFFNQQPRTVKLSQLKIISLKRLTRKLGTLDHKQFDYIVRILVASLV